MHRLNLMTPDEAAEALEVSEQTLANWRQSGRHDLKYYKIGRLIRYDADDIQDLLDAAEESPSDFRDHDTEIEDDDD